MITDRPRSLPDCALCGEPISRWTSKRNGGMCTACRKVYDQRAAQQLPLPLETEPAPPDLTNVVVLDTRRPRPGGRR
jgi:hypothetical protein